MISCVLIHCVIYCGGSDVCMWVSLFLILTYDLHVYVTLYLVIPGRNQRFFSFLYKSEKNHVVYDININCFLPSLAGIFNYFLEIHVSNTMLINIDCYKLLTSYNILISLKQFYIKFTHVKISERSQVHRLRCKGGQVTG